jgi:hypothetical protein
MRIRHNIWFCSSLQILKKIRASFGSYTSQLADYVFSRLQKILERVVKRLSKRPSWFLWNCQMKENTAATFLRALSFRDSWSICSMHELSHFNSLCYGWQEKATRWVELAFLCLSTFCFGVQNHPLFVKFCSFPLLINCVDNYYNTTVSVLDGLFHAFVFWALVPLFLHNLT